MGNSSDNLLVEMSDNIIHPDSRHQKIQGCSNKSLLYILAIVSASCVSLSIIVHHHGSYDTKQIINEQNSVISDFDLKYSDVDRRLNDASTITDSGNLIQCNPVDNEWCMVQMPSISYFGFDPPTDHQRWEHSKIAAMNGDPVLLSRIVKHFTSHLDFLNGDTYFRRYHELADFFFDRNSGLSPVLNNDLSEPPLQPAPYPWERSGYSVLPRNYNQFRKYKRAAIIKLGYHAFQKVHDVPFVGAPIGKALMHRRVFFEYWNTVKDRIVHPFILLDVHDENWGLLSTYFPNRTSNWGICCNQSYDSLIMDFLNHDKTIMMVINQHSNYTHPKIVSSPRGLPIHEHRSRIIWDVMREVLQMNTRKSKLVYSALTNSVSRPQILACIRNKFIGKDASELIVDLRTDKEEQLAMKKMGKIAFRRSYYNQLASTRVGLALPGIGYDTWRLWEMLTLGTVPVLERAVGLDKTVSLMFYVPHYITIINGSSSSLYTLLRYGDFQHYW